MSGISISPKSNEPNRNYEDFALRNHNNRLPTANRMQVSAAGSSMMIEISPVLAIPQPSLTTQ